MSYWVDSKQLINKSKSLGADTILFKVGREHESVGVFSSDLELSLQDLKRMPKRVRYKFQRRDVDGTLKDLTSYAELFDFRAVYAEIRASRFDATPSIHMEDLELARERDPKGFRAALARASMTLRRGALQRDGSTVQLKTALSYFDSVSQRIIDPHLDYLRAFLVLLVKAYENGLFEALQTPIYINKVLDIIEATKKFQMTDDMGNISEQIVEVARSNLLGQLFSLFDRDLASFQFSAMQAADVQSLVRDFYYDMGAMTYFSTAEVEIPSIRARAQKIKSQLSDLNDSSSQNTMAVVVSADEAFFRTYAHQMLHYAQQLPELDFAFVLCAPVSEARTLIHHASRHLETLADLNLSGDVRNIRYMHAPMPSGVKNEISFYASARFFSAGRLLEDYEQLYLMDIDLQFTEDPMAFFNRLKRAPFSVPVLARSGSWKRWSA